MRWGGGVGDTASMDRSKLLLSDDLLLELETTVRKVFTVPGVAPTSFYSVGLPNMPPFSIVSY